MSGLSPDARKLLDAARTADRRTPADRSRVRASLQKRLALSAALAAVPASATLLTKAVAGGALLAALTVGVTVSRTPSEPPASPRRAPPAASVRRVAPASAPLVAPSAAPVVPAVAAVVAPPAPSLPEPPRVVVRHVRSTVATPPTIAAPVVPEPPTVAPAEPDPLADELRSLGDAQVAFDQGHGDRALRLLDAYAAGHPQGALWEESAALRALSLCALGRTSEARAATATLLRESPRSPAAARVRTSCVGATIPTRIDEPPGIP